MKFKVGDKVRVKKDLVIGNWYGKDTFSSGMKDSLGGVFEVEKIVGYGYILSCSDIHIYTDEMLEPVDDAIPEKLVIYRNSNKTIAKYYKGNKTVTAESKCAPEDEFDFEYGAKLAMDRAIEKMKEEEIGYSWVRCVGYRQKREFNFTVGGKYKIFSNGRITDDMGYTYISKETKEDMLSFLGDYYIFEEVN